MLFESIYLAESHNFHNRQSLTGGRNGEATALPEKQNPVNLKYSSSGFQPVFWDTEKQIAQA